VVGFVLGALAAAWSAIAVDIVVESTLDDTDRFVLFGRTIVASTPAIEVFVCVGLGISVAVIATTWIVGSIHRRRELQLRVAVDRRWEEISNWNAGMEARNELLEWRLQDLQEQIDTLMQRRDQLLADTRRNPAEAREAVRTTRARDSLRRLQHGVIELPDLDDEPVAGGGEAVAEPDPSIAGDNVRRFPA
jgi:hypothetical protein